MPILLQQLPRLPFVPVRVAACLHAGRSRSSGRWPAATAAGGGAQLAGKEAWLVTPVTRTPGFRGGWPRSQAAVLSQQRKLHMVSRSGQQIQTDWTGSGSGREWLSKQFPSTSWTSTRMSPLARPTCLPAPADHREEFWKQLQAASTNANDTRS